MITAKELRELLANIPDDTPIILQKDDEGNGYRYMNGLDFVADGDDANYFDGDDVVVRAAEFGDDEIWGSLSKEDYPHLVAVAY